MSMAPYLLFHFQLLTLPFVLFKPLHKLVRPSVPFSLLFFSSPLYLTSCSKARANITYETPARLDMLQWTAFKRLYARQPNASVMATSRWESQVGGLFRFGVSSHTFPQSSYQLYLKALDVAVHQLQQVEFVDQCNYIPEIDQSTHLFIFL